MAGKTTSGGKGPIEDRIVEAAFASARDVGYAGSSARVIAAAGGFNQALIFYHFGGVDAALLAALDRSTEARLARYRECLGAVQTLPEMVESAQMLFKEDFESGHVKLLAEMVAAGASDPVLGKEVAARVEPWLAFTGETFERLMGGSPLAALVASNDAAYALTALYLGMELMSNLDGSRDRSDALFGAAGRLAALLGMLMPVTVGPPSLQPRDGGDDQRPQKTQQAQKG